MSVPLRAGVLVADDHSLVRRGLRALIDGVADLRVAAEAADGEEALRAAGQPEVDLALLDLTMPGLGGLEVTRRLRAARPSLPVLVLSVHDGERHVFEAVRAGARGYVVKSAADDRLVDACRRVLRGERFVVPPDASKAVLAAVARAQAGERDASPLSPREAEVACLVADGVPAADIATELGISPKTVERHRENIAAKLDLADRVELTRYVVREGLVDA
jgi:DNA-binding NarL/FixJ family response regulator